MDTVLFLWYTWSEAKRRLKLENQGYYFRVGLFCSIVLTLMLLGLFLLVRPKSGSESYYLLFFDQNVEGLSTGAKVTYQGIEVGQVAEISLNKNGKTIDVLIKTYDDKVTLYDNTIAQLQTYGITGGLFIQLSPLDFPPPQVIEKNESGIPIIPTKPAAISQFLENGQQIISKLDLLLEKLNDTYDGEAAKHVKSSLMNIEKFTKSLANETNSVEIILTNLNETIKNIDELVVYLKEAAEETPALVGDTRDLVKNANTLVSSYDNLSGDLKKKVMPNIENSIDELKNTIEDINNFVNTISQNPQSVIKSPQYNGYNIIGD